MATKRRGNEHDGSVTDDVGMDGGVNVGHEGMGHDGSALMGGGMVPGVDMMGKRKGSPTAKGMETTAKRKKLKKKSIRVSVDEQLVTVIAERESMEELASRYRQPNVLAPLLVEFIVNRFDRFEDEFIRFAKDKENNMSKQLKSYYRVKEKRLKGGMNADEAVQAALAAGGPATRSQIPVATQPPPPPAPVQSQGVGMLTGGDGQQE